MVETNGTCEADADQVARGREPTELVQLSHASHGSSIAGTEERTTSLEEDLRDIQDAASLEEAIANLVKRFPHDQPLTAEDFLRDYTDSKFGTFFLFNIRTGYET